VAFEKQVTLTFWLCRPLNQIDKKEENMRSSNRLGISTLITLCLLAPVALSQSGSTGGSTGSSGSSGGNRGTTTTTNTPTNRGTINNPQNNSNMDRPVYLISGKVLMEDGAPPPEPVAVERVCNGQSRREGYTDSHGQFQFQMGQNNGVLQDATTSNFDLSMNQRNSSVFGAPQNGISSRDLLGCEMRAALPGFQSSTVMLRPEGSFGQLEVGTIFLKRLGESQGATVSLTTMQAPKDARHAFEKGQKASMQKKFADAETELKKAVEIYPHFAAAWSLLGAVYEQQNQFDDARNAYTQAVSSDSKFVNPYFGMAMLAIRERKWQDAVQYTEQVAKLNAFAFPQAYFFNAAANFNMGNMEAAEKSARKFLALDSEHRRPECALLLGEILSAKHDYAGAAAQKRSYLTMSPNAPNAEAVRTDVKRLEDLSQSKPN
jgi:tetratricopeptide (TPR) repeat protein